MTDIDINWGSRDGLSKESWNEPAIVFGFSRISKYVKSLKLNASEESLQWRDNLVRVFEDMIREIENERQKSHAVERAF